MEGLSYQEVADVMDTSVSAVESLLHRARLNLRKTLENPFSDG
jgi:RNA polymerase sigma-70 factor (ECF subfamily)